MNRAQEEREALQRAVEAALPLVADNHVFDHQWIINALEVGPEPSEVAAYKKWQMKCTRMEIKWRETLLETYGLVVKSVHAQGYRLVPKAEVTDTVYYDGTHEAMKKLWQVATTLGRASINGLSHQEIAYRRDRAASASSLYVMTKMARKRAPRPGIKPPAEVIDSEGK